MKLFIKYWKLVKVANWQLITIQSIIVSSKSNVMNMRLTNPMQWKQLCITILQKCIILPIECDTPETALTIFSTLNDRGLPLADSDIFKAQIYRNLGNRRETQGIYKYMEGAHAYL